MDIVVLLVYGLHLSLPIVLAAAWYTKTNLEHIRREKRLMGTIYRMTKRWK